MNIHVLQHLAVEDAAHIVDWARDRGHRLTRTALHAGEALPSLAGVDLAVVLGGSMSVNDEADYPWLRQEKDWIKAALHGGKRVLGICLGAQLMAEVLGGPVTKNRWREIGWHPVRLCVSERPLSGLFAGFPETLTVFQWHGDTFALPPGATRLAVSEACANQAFLWGDRAVGLQFHLEYAAGTIEAMLGKFGDEWRAGGPFVQTAEQIRAQLHRVPELHAWLERFLDRLAAIG